MAITTRLSLYGGPGRPYATFLPKSSAAGGSCDLTEVLAAIAALQATTDGLVVTVNNIDGIVTGLATNMATLLIAIEGLEAGSGDHELLLKYVKAILHDNKMLLDLVEGLKGKNASSTPGKEAPRDPRRGRS